MHRQTDILIARPRLHSMQRGKKQENAWDSLEMGADGKFLQPEVGGNKFLGYPSFF